MKRERERERERGKIKKKITDIMEVNKTREKTKDFD